MAKNAQSALDLNALVVRQAEAVVACVNEGQAEGIARLDMAGALDFARLMTDSLQGTLQSLEHSFADAVRAAAKDIHELRHEIATLGVDSMRADHLPEAGQELNAVVQETEKATDRIMESAEAIMSADREDKAAFETLVDAQMLAIFEACTFQDITGQRIAKVVETLERLEHRFDRLLEALPEGGADMAFTADEEARDKRKEEQILNGPQIDGPQVDQNAIDELFD
ncbi:MAG: protein phosphatase CheZ [Cohaesibacteraceae bacterium]